MNTKVLVVDNHPVMLEYMSGVLEQEGCDVRTAVDGLAALSVLAEFTPHIVFVDLIMPNIDGAKLSKIIRRRSELNDTRIVILSAVAAEENEADRLTFADACIAKGPLKQMRQHVLTALHGVGAGEVTGTIGLENVYSRHITTELLQSKKHAEALLGSMNEAVLELTAEGSIVAANYAAIALFDAAEEDLLSRSFVELFSSAQRPYVDELMGGSPGYARETTENRPLYIRGVRALLDVVTVADRDVISSIVILQDVSVRKDAEERLQASLEEKDMLLKEAYHRVRNNLQVVSSLLQLQAAVYNDERLSHAVEESRSRIDAMTLVHEQLYKSESVATVDLSSYLESLAGNLVAMYGADAVIDTDVQNIQLETRLAVPCGIILNELVSNAIRHAAPPGGQARVSIRARRVGTDVIELTVDDQGPGLGGTVPDSTTLGLQLVDGLIANQLDGTHEISEKNGLRHIIRFRASG